MTTTENETAADPHGATHWLLAEGLGSSGYAFKAVAPDGALIAGTIKVNKRAPRFKLDVNRRDGMTTMGVSGKFKTPDAAAEFVVSRFDVVPPPPLTLETVVDEINYLSSLVESADGLRLVAQNLAQFQATPGVR